MNKNQKIAVGCGAVGCLGLIVVAIAAGAFFYWRSQQGPPRREYESRNFNFNTNSNLNQNSNSNENQNSGSNNSSDSRSESSTLSDDDRHKLFQAAGMTKDQELMVKVMKKIGLFKANGTPAADYPGFLKDHFTWGVSNREFINSVNTPETAKAYIDQHLPE